MTDSVEPNHYTRWKIQPIEFIRANQLDFARANIIKYIMRYDDKDGMKDLEKALQYLKWLMEDHKNKGPFRIEATYPIVQNKLAMSQADKLEAAWRRVIHGWGSKAEIAKGCGVADGTVGEMRRAKRWLEDNPEASSGRPISDFKWREAQMTYKNRQPVRLDEQENMPAEAIEAESIYGKDFGQS